MAETSIQLLGISFGAEETCLVEVERQFGKSKVTNLFTNKFPFPLTLSTFADADNRALIGEQLLDLLEQHEVTAQNTALALDASTALVKRVPIDNTLKPKELQEHVEWELAQYLLRPVSEYQLDFQRLPPVLQSDPHFMVFVAVRKDILEYIEDIASMANLNLIIIDIDSLAALNAIELHYDLQPDTLQCALSVGSDRLHFSVLQGNNFLGHHTSQIDEALQHSPDKLFEEISKNLRFLFADFINDESKTSFDRIFCYKEHSDISLSDILSHANQQEFELVNPFQDLKVTEGVTEYINNASDLSHFTKAVGLATRKITS